MNIFNKSTSNASVKAFGLIGGVALGISQIIAGDYVNGVGLIFASLSSGGVIGGKTAE